MELPKVVYFNRLAPLKGDHEDQQKIQNIKTEKDGSFLSNLYVARFGVTKEE